MTGVPALAIIAGMLAVVVGLPFGLYALLTRGRRRSMRQLRAAVAERGWQFRQRRWYGDPTMFRIQGRTHGGLAWIMESFTTHGYDPGWAVRLGLRFPVLGGEADFALLPREPAGRGSGLLQPGLPGIAPAEMPAFGDATGSVVGFFRDARESPSGLPAFDAAYQVLGRPSQIRPPLVDQALAARVLRWPADAIAPHSVLAWRDPFGLHFQARLPAAPNWETVSYFLALAKEFTQRLPAPMTAPTPRGFVDRLLARLLGS
jgi:hypothetical protein